MQKYTLQQVKSQRISIVVDNEQQARTTLRLFGKEDKLPYLKYPAYLCFYSKRGFEWSTSSFLTNDYWNTWDTRTSSEIHFNDLLFDLQVGDKLELFGDEYEVKHWGSSYCYSLYGTVVHHTECFRKAGIEDGFEFQGKVLGYIEHHGYFPFCRSLSDLTKFVEAIRGYKKTEAGFILPSQLTEKSDPFNDRPHIGYIVPYDLYGGRVPAGTIIQPSFNIGNNKYNYNGNQLPAEWVETWQKAYEKTLTLNGEFTKQQLETLIQKQF